MKAGKLESLDAGRSKSRQSFGPPGFRASSPSSLLASLPSSLPAFLLSSLLASWSPRLPAFWLPSLLASWLHCLLAFQPPGFPAFLLPGLLAFQPPGFPALNLLQLILPPFDPASTYLTQVLGDLLYSEARDRQTHPGHRWPPPLPYAPHTLW